MANLNCYNPLNIGDVNEVQTMFWAGLVTKDEWERWLGAIYTSPKPASIVETKLPEHCSECNHHNPYVGKEHMVYEQTGKAEDCGKELSPKYVCRQCKPKWARQQRLAKIKLEAEAREARKTDYSGGANPPYQGPVQQWMGKSWVVKL